MCAAFRTDEVATSQLPAMLLLAKMGWQPLTKAQANAARKTRTSAVILEDITRDYLRTRRLSWAGQDAPLSEDNIETLMVRLKNLPPATYGKQAEEKWDLLCLPQSVEQVINGSRRSHNVPLIDFDNPTNNQFHMAAEFSVERSKSVDKRRPDIVLFVNGIPMVVIENKKAATDVEQGITQTIRNQKPDEIPHLYVYAQILMSVNKNENRYATTGTPAKLWNVWKENEIGDAVLRGLIDTPLSDDQHDALFSDDFAGEGLFEAGQEGRLITDQDRALVGLCRPDRLLRLTREFILFDGPHKIISRFQQFDAVRKTVSRVERGGDRRGGVIWHTQGSGKSLTMVMLARALISHSTLNDARIVLVTDRVDLDKQIKGTFKNTGMSPKRAATGKELISLIAERKARVITTIINKFEAAARDQLRDESSDVFVLVDEGHRSQYGRYSAQMRRVFPNATYIAFTGTPIAKKDKNTMSEFGPIIDTYTMRDAVEDGAVVPLVYEGRLIKPDMDSKGLDTWFERLTIGLTDAQKADLKKKYAQANMLGKLDKVIACRAFDISEHFRANFKGTGLKAQLVAPSKAAALKYKAALDDIGHVTSEVLISSPDTREGHDAVDEAKATDEVVEFWQQMMTRYGDEEKYNEHIINQFKHGDDPEIIIVVSKLLTGFDAPRNTVLYLTRPMKEHNLLQAIARVNRVLDSDSDDYNTDKDEGYIVDYEGVLENLDEAFSHYDALAGYEEKDLEGLMRNVGEILDKLPQTHSHLWALFQSLDGNADEEAYEVFLADDAIREDFYGRLTAYGKALAAALGAARFYDETPEADIHRYKRDLKRFTNLRSAVKRRYAEEVDFSDYEKRIEKILHDHVGATDIELVIPPVNIFNLEMMKETEEKLGSDRAKADFIAHSTKRTITEKMEENPALYKKLSDLLETLINDFIEGRYAEAEYLKRVRDIHATVLSEGQEETPNALADDANAAAYHGYLLTGPTKDAGADEDTQIAFAKFISQTLDGYRNVPQLFQQTAKLNEIRLAIDNYMYDVLLDEQGVSLSPEQMDVIIENIMTIAERRLS
jgi:type I restriction enzyme R subunit